jgi:glycosyltransferase involved in cell wall biosynthesis
VIEEILHDYKDMYFVFAGKDAGLEGKTMMEHIWKKAGKHRGKTIYLGLLNKTHLNEIINNAEVIVLPSKVDNFPNTAVESMSLGKTVIGTYEGGFDQLIKDGVNGFLINAHSASALKDAVNKSLQLPECEKQTLVQNAKATVERLDIQKIADKLLKYYQNTIERSVRKR